MKYKVTIPDLSLEEAVSLLEQIGCGELIYCNEDGTPNTPDRPFSKLFAYPRDNQAMIEIQKEMNDE